MLASRGMDLPPLELIHKRKPQYSSVRCFHTDSFMSFIQN